jgi:hypothetical protein
MVFFCAAKVTDTGAILKLYVKTTWKDAAGRFEATQNRFLQSIVLIWQVFCLIL